MIGINRKIRSLNVASHDLISYSSTSPNQDFLNNINFYDILGKSTIQPRFRLQWLYGDETVKDILPEEDIILGGNYSENYQNGQRRSVSISLSNNSRKYTPSINGLWAGTKFLFEMGLQLQDGNTIWFSKGVYNLISINSSHTTGGNTVNLELSDKYSSLEGAEGTLETSYTIPTGTLIEDLIRDILTTPKGNGEMLDPKTFIYDSSFKKKRTQAKIVKEAGGTFGSMLLDIATMLSAEVFYDVEGHLNFVPINDVSKDVDKPILYNLYEYKGDFGSNNLNFDMNAIVNRVIVIGANVNGEICDATAINDDASSPLSYQRIGYRTASPINDSNITSTIVAQERADYELRQKLILKSSVNNDITFNPLLLVNNLISITDEFYNFKQEKFLIQSISCPIDYAGTMSLTSTNIRNLPFVVGG